MFQGIVMFGKALSSFITPMTLFHALWATQLGILVGMLPGLTATMGVALLTTLTIGMAPNDAILVLICMYTGTIYGGSRTAILLNIPGTPANAATTVDGFPLAKAGQAGKAIAVATTGSFLGSVVGVIAMAFFTPMLGNIALKFHSYEFVWFAIFGIVICGNLTAPKDPLKGWISGFLGLFVAMIGMEGIHGYVRYSFGNINLASGVDLIPAMVGAFGFAEIITVMSQTKLEVVKTEIQRILPPFRELARYWKTVIRSGLIGTFIGAVPGVGEDIAAWVSYDMAKRSAKPEDAEKFGKGSVEGLLAAETGNNACIPGALIPVLTLAVPGSAAAAVLLGAMLIHGIRPGPLIMIENPKYIYEVTAMTLISTVFMFILGLAMVKSLVKVLTIPRQKLMPIVFTLCVMGSFALSSQLYHVGIMVVFGLIGYVLRKMDYPMAPLVLGIILGKIMDQHLRRALILSDGSLKPFFARPICLVLFIITALVIISRLPVTTKIMASIKAKRQVKKG
ncbi:MAG: tripartite tricarboxylate transporter permease [Treponema sp.]|jgi:putative tricarboxylic transport membrane protein|nr:tripartite tricarboxylate transporter permease [Treponema sp.]